MKNRTYSLKRTLGNATTSYDLPFAYVSPEKIEAEIFKKTYELLSE